MKLLIIFSLFCTFPALADMNLFVHTYVYCGGKTKAKQALLFNAFSKPDLCENGLVPYPASETTCKDSAELIDRCTRPIECSASFACRISDETINSRELIRKVMRNEDLLLYHVKKPELDIPEEKVFEVEVQAPVTPVTPTEEVPTEVAPSPVETEP